MSRIINFDCLNRNYENTKLFWIKAEYIETNLLVRHRGVIKFLMKGADSIVFERLNQEVDQPFMANFDEKLTEYSVQGLRTLLFAMKVLDEEEYSKIQDDLSEISVMKNSKERRNQYVSDIETNFIAIGMTAVEDRLQDEVPECIADFIQANIKVWMLTGDKLETAENIGYSCSLLQKDFDKFYLRRDDDYQQKTDDLKNFLDSNESKHPGNKKKICVLIEGSALLAIAQNKELLKSLVISGLARADSVICCRMNPKQKGDIVKMVKLYMKKITLGIGDGANDVNMIQEADIGIGLYGKEGLRAVQSSVLIEGSALLAIAQNKELLKSLVISGLARADSVICCRMNPKQKGDIVKMVKLYMKKITLGIGDGANDVNMIQEADIGIGLYGKEGLRAVQSSDYALVEFKALWKLLFVHGRWSYIR